MDTVMPRLGKQRCRKKKQGGNRQQGRDGSVRTHRDFEGAERQSNSYLIETCASSEGNQKGSVY